MTYANGSQTALSCALYHGFVPDQYKAKIAQKLVEVVHAKNDHIDTGILGARYIQHVLTNYGQPELAYKLVSTKTYPGWGYWIEQGATTLWEDWRGEASLNHIMLGDVSSWFYKTISGIQPDESRPGFNHFTIKPEVTADLKWAEGSYESVYGTITSDWRVEGGQFVHEIQVPVNTTATYYPPTDKLSALKESGMAIKLSDFQSANAKNGKALMLKSGKYQFSFPMK
jgi:alpha-L-rhamnosidase